jgi:Beta-lactamase
MTDPSGYAKTLALPAGFDAPRLLRYDDVTAHAITRDDLGADVRGINASLDLIRETRGGTWPTGPVTEEEGLRRPGPARVSGMAAAAPSAGAKGFSPKLQRKLAPVTRNNMTEARLPGAAVGIWAPGRGRYVRAFGITDRATGRPARTTDHVRIASITKTFTATAILQLVQRGRLSLDDHLSQYVSGVPYGTSSASDRCST